MITDMQLGVMANALGIAMLLLVVFFHYVTTSQRQKK
uniref:Dolichyl-diphosphooligosaccharide--protein glycosyltransferase subunit 4 n=1 Tax=Elaeophora elaphi TaxID=1147741 RepID=A0A0R3RX20_9BILA